MTVFGDKKGNCFSACLASLFSLKIDEVPNFCGDDLKNWPENMQHWLGQRGFSNVTVVFGEDPKGEWMVHLGYSIVTGKSPRFDCLHCVVFYGPKMVHDPHPDRTGLLSFDTVDLLVPKVFSSE